MVVYYIWTNASVHVAGSNRSDDQLDSSMRMVSHMPSTCISEHRKVPKIKRFSDRSER